MDYQFDRLQRRSAPRRPGIGALLYVATRPQTYANLAYLATAFPLGLVYFIFLVVGISVGVSTAILGVGLALLVIVMLVWWGVAAFERELTMWWLGVRIAPMSVPMPQDAGNWKRFIALLRNPVTWKSLIYLLLKFPFGILSFISTTAVFALAVGLIFSPVAYLGSVMLHGDGSGQGIFWRDIGFAVGGPLVPLFLLVTFVMSGAGILLLVGALYTFNGLAYVWGQFARLMLGISDTSARLVEARATAARERSRAEHADQSRRELIVNVSHELRTPIANISGHVETLLMANGPDISEANARHYLEIISREAERLSSLIDDLLALARADAGELKLDVRPIAAGDAVEEVYQSLEPLAKRDRQVKVVRSVTPELPPVLADRDRLVQVLLNLVRNAITYTPPGGIVSISVERADDWHIAITVADTGIGIPPDELNRVFDRFYRTDASRARASGGFGLGLAIARDLIQAMGGTIAVASKSGEGSQFRILLRVA